MTLAEFTFLWVDAFSNSHAGGDEFCKGNGSQGRESNGGGLLKEVGNSLCNKGILEL